MRVAFSRSGSQGIEYSHHACGPQPRDFSTCPPSTIAPVCAIWIFELQGGTWSAEFSERVAAKNILCAEVANSMSAVRGL